MESENPPAYVLSLDDYTLSHIFEHLNATDFWHLSQTCRRFYDMLKSKRFWRKIEARDKPNCQTKINFCLNRVVDTTEDLRLCGEKRYKQILPTQFPKLLTCTNLTVLALENQLIEGDLAKLSEYPASLVELSLRKSYVHNADQFFKFGHEKMNNLRVLLLDQCFWLSTHMLIQLSKYTNIEILSLYMCKKLSDTDIAYISLAGCYGFKKLKILDCRFSGLGDQILKSFYNKASLKELYFQNYVTTYTLEVGQRLLDIAHGAPELKYQYHSEYDGIQDMSVSNMKGYFGDQNFTKWPQNSVSDDGTRSLRLLNAANEDYEIKSALYESPYGKCTCFDEKPDLPSKQKNKGPASKMKGLRKKEIAKLEEKVKRAERAKNLNNYVFMMTPTEENNQDRSDAQQASSSRENPYTGWMMHREPRNAFEMAQLEHSELNPETVAHATCDGCNVVVGVRFYRTAVPQVQPVVQAAGQAIIVQPAGDRNDSPERYPVGRMIVEALDESENDEPHDRGKVQTIKGGLRIKSNNLGTKSKDHGKNCPATREKGERKAVEGESSKVEENDAKNAKENQSADAKVSNRLLLEFVPVRKEQRGQKRLRGESMELHDIKKKRMKILNPGPSGLGERAVQPMVRIGRSGDGYHIHVQMTERRLADGIRRTIKQDDDEVKRSHITKLSFRGYQGVTDDTLASAMYLNLKLLDVTGTRVTDAGVKEFAAINPNCRVIHESTCKCRPRIHF